MTVTSPGRESFDIGALLTYTYRDPMFYDFLLLLKNPHVRPQAVRIWLGWLAATTAGWATAGLTGLPIGRMVFVEGGWMALLNVAANMGLIGALVGGLTGAGQWLFFRRRFPGAAWWLIATAAGWGAGFPLALMANYWLAAGVSTSLYGLFVGAGVASLQRLLCRPVVPAFPRWLFANLLAFVLGFSGAGILERSLLEATGGSWGISAWQSALTAGLAGLIAGSLTGVALTVLLAGRSGKTHAA